MYTTYRISGYTNVELEDCSQYHPDEESKYHIIKFSGHQGNLTEVELFFSCNNVYQLVVEMVPNSTGRGPYKLTRDGEEVWVLVDWHYEQPDDYIVIDAVFLDNERIDGTEEENQALIEQIYDWELFR